MMVFLDDVQHSIRIFTTLTYFFSHPIYFARLRHANPLCKHKQENLQRKESSDQKMQENKPVLELKNTKEKVCQKLKLKKNIFHCALFYGALYTKNTGNYCL